MADHVDYNAQLAQDGYSVMPGIFSGNELHAIEMALQRADTSAPSFRKSTDLFAVRRVMQEVPEIVPPVFTQALTDAIMRLFGQDYFVVKSIYFDKPATSNWFVSYHQDLTISVDRKADLPGFIHWTVKQEQYAVQPPLAILEDNFTIRIHLDDTDKDNGALHILPGSHEWGIYPAERISAAAENEVICDVPAGGIMIMKPLLMHASGKTTNSRRRRVLHIEFSKATLPPPLQWSELLYP